MYRQILKKYSTVFRIGFSVLVLIFVLYRIDDKKVVSLLSPVDVRWVGYLLAFEGLLMYFFSLLGLSTAGAFSIGLLGHVGMLLACVPGFIFYIWDKKSIPAEEG